MANHGEAQVRRCVRYATVMQQYAADMLVMREICRGICYQACDAYGQLCSVCGVLICVYAFNMCNMRLEIMRRYAALCARTENASVCAHKVVCDGMCTRRMHCYVLTSYVFLRLCKYYAI